MAVPYNQTEREVGDDRGRYYCESCGGFSTKCYRCDNLVPTTGDGDPRRCGADLTKQSTTTRGERFDASV